MRRVDAFSGGVGRTHVSIVNPLLRFFKLKQIVVYRICFAITALDCISFTVYKMCINCMLCIGRILDLHYGEKRCSRVRRCQK